MNNQIKNIVILWILFLTGFTSCSEKELTHEEKLKEVVEVYVADMLKSEPILEYSVDSIEIRNATPKDVLIDELTELSDTVKKMANRLKGLKKEFYDKQELIEMCNRLKNNKNNAFKLKNEMASKEINNNYEKLLAEANETFSLIKVKQKELLTADNKTIVYYKVFASTTITSIKNVIRKGMYPFHISKDYKILIEPKDYK